MAKTIKVGVMPGDYIGPEIMAEALKVLRLVADQSKLDLDVQFLEASGDAFDKYGVHLPETTLTAAATCGALLKGPFGGPPEELHHPKWSGVEQGAILPLRKHFNLFANLREMKVLDDLIHLSPLKAEIVSGANVMIVRELISGIYFGPKASGVVDGERQASDLEVYRESEIRRIAIRAYELARTRRRKVTLVAKSNVLTSSVLWRDVVNEVARDYPDVESDYLHVDNASMQLILNPRQFDVILTSNMFGDILSDEASVLAGSIGLFPSASLGETPFGLYEPVHGSAPSIAGKNIANPVSAILCLPLMLRYSFGEVEAAETIERAVEAVFAKGYRTVDLITETDPKEKLLGTKEFGDAVVSEIKKHGPVGAPAA